MKAREEREIYEKLGRGRTETEVEHIEGGRCIAAEDPSLFAALHAALGLQSADSVQTQSSAKIHPHSLFLSTPTPLSLSLTLSLSIYLHLLQRPAACSRLSIYIL